MYVAQPIEWTENGVVMLDQRRLPAEEISYTYTDYQGVAKAIHEMVIRGAPAIGVAAAMGVAIGVQKSQATSIDALKAEFAEICEVLSKTRPTAVDLFWALQRMKNRFRDLLASSADLATIRATLVEEAYTEQNPVYVGNINAPRQIVIVVPMKVWTKYWKLPESAAPVKQYDSLCPNPHTVRYFNPWRMP